VCAGTAKTASATIKGFEVMRMIRSGHFLTCKPCVRDKNCFVSKLFDVFEIAALSITNPKTNYPSTS
jgi:transposase, IS6 family